MNYTFMFRIARGAAFRRDGVQQWNTEAEQVFYVRWVSKHAFQSQRKRAREVIARHVYEEIRADMDKARTFYASWFLDQLSEVLVYNWLVRFSGHEIGHPRFVRVEQPDSYR